MGVYTKVSKKRCYDVTVKAPIGVRWIDINKHDDPVTKDFNKGKDPDKNTQHRRRNSSECWRVWRQAEKEKAVDDGSKR